VPDPVFVLLGWLLLLESSKGRFERSQCQNNAGGNLAGQGQDDETCWNQLGQAGVKSLCQNTIPRMALSKRACLSSGVSGKAKEVGISKLAEPADHEDVRSKGGDTGLSAHIFLALNWH
jgi:hypothetical protein